MKTALAFSVPEVLQHNVTVIHSLDYFQPATNISIILIFYIIIYINLY